MINNFSRLKLHNIYANTQNSDFLITCSKHCSHHRPETISGE